MRPRLIQILPPKICVFGCLCNTNEAIFFSSFVFFSVCSSHRCRFEKRSCRVRAVEPFCQFIYSHTQTPIKAGSVCVRSSRRASHSTTTYGMCRIRARLCTVRDCQPATHILCIVVIGGGGSIVVAFDRDTRLQANM